MAVGPVTPTSIATVSGALDPLAPAASDSVAPATTPTRANPATDTHERTSRPTVRTRLRRPDEVPRSRGLLAAPSSTTALRSIAPRIPCMLETPLVLTRTAASRPSPRQSGPGWLHPRSAADRHAVGDAPSEPTVVGCAAKAASASRLFQWAKRASAFHPSLGATWNAIALGTAPPACPSFPWTALRRPCGSLTGTVRLLRVAVFAHTRRY